MTFTSSGLSTSAFSARARRSVFVTSTGVGTSSFVPNARRGLTFTSIGSSTSTFVVTLAEQRPRLSGMLDAYRPPERIGERATSGSGGHVDELELAGRGPRAGMGGKPRGGAGGHRL